MEDPEFGYQRPAQHLGERRHRRGRDGVFGVLTDIDEFGIGEGNPNRLALPAVG